MKSKMAFRCALGIWFVVSLAFGVQADELVLFDFQPKTDTSRFELRDARLTYANASLRVNTGNKESWPGITLPAPSGRWDLSRHGQVTVALRNPSAHDVTVHCRIDNPGADGTRHCLNGNLKLKAGTAGSLRVDLRHGGGDTLDGKLFGMRGYPVGPGGQNAEGGIDISNIVALVLFVDHPKNDEVFDIQSIRATGVYVPPTASTLDASPFFPFIDTFGQYRHKDWPGKVKSLADLIARRTLESADLSSNAAPSSWDQYGGWKGGPSFKTTGFFRTINYKGKWWLLDPEGKLFFSQGIDCVRMLDSTPVEERTDWFENFPGNQPEFASFFGQGKVLYGHYAGKTVRSYSFAGANLARKYGPDWQVAVAPLVHQRLRSWGINTIGNWSDSGVCRLRRTPYTDTIGTWGARMIEGSEGYWGKFPDVFDTSFAEAASRAMSGKKDTSANDPWCIGYFSDNEMSWGDDTSLALAALKSPADQPAKAVFVEDLKTQYVDITKLNQAWGTKYESWDALRQSRETPSVEKAGPDLRCFYSKAAEQYFRVIRDAIRAVAPQQLYLGCRFAAVNDRAAEAAAKYCNVVSYNLYQTSIADFHFNGGADVPLMVGEFHFGALDRGLFHTGLVPVATQEARAKAYKDYVLGAAAHPQFVGVHWFQWQDEPVTGRVYDEENYQIGFLDVADSPYPEMIAASREIAARLYPHRLGR
jgi:hypothetical protein